VKRIVPLIVAAVIFASCGSDSTSKSVATRVQPSLVPAALGDGSLALQEDETAHKAFANAGAQSLVDDGRLWAIRDGDQLVATLQVATLDPKVDLGDGDEVEALIRSILPGTKERFTIADLDVVQVATEDKTVYLWFGRSMFQILQIKGTAIDPEVLLGELIAFQTSLPEWRPAPSIPTT
jgi:hypothetical protein